MSTPERPACYACEEQHEASRPDPSSRQDALEGDSVSDSHPDGREFRSRTIAWSEADPGTGSFADRFATTRIGGSDEPASPRPPRRRRIDVDLLRAPFDDAVRFLAESGKFDVIVEAPSATDVTVSLHGVDPFDALELIAEAKGLKVRTRHGVVIVSP